jgi:ribonuclease HII
VVLDGRLHAPKEYRQQTIIHGDDLIPAISLAAVLAKVSRDHLMGRMAVRHPGYGFEEHKGYGTQAHRDALQKLGPCPIHRMSYLSGILGDTIAA